MGCCTSRTSGGFHDLLPQEVSSTIVNASGLRTVNLESINQLKTATTVVISELDLFVNGEPQITSIWLDGKISKAVSKELLGKDDKLEYEPKSMTMKNFIQAFALVTDCFFENTKLPEGKKWIDQKAEGIPREVALLKFLQPLENISTIRVKSQCRPGDNNKIAKVGYSHETRVQYIVRKMEMENSVSCVFAYGDVDRVWGLCNQIFVGGKATPLDESWRSKYEETRAALESRGEKVYGFARCHVPKDKYHDKFAFEFKGLDNNNYPWDNYIFLGMVSIKEEINHELKQAFLNAKDAGLNVLLYSQTTTDHAQAVAKEVGLLTPENDKSVYSGANVDKLLKEDKSGKKLATELNKQAAVIGGGSLSKLKDVIGALKAENHNVVFVGPESDNENASNADVRVNDGNPETPSKDSDLLLGESNAPLANLISLLANGKRFRDQKN